MRGAECPAEVAGARKAPPSSDCGDRPGGQCRIREVSAAVVKTLPPDRARDRQALVVEELVQGAHRHVVGSGDHDGRKPSVTQVLPDEGLHRDEQGVPAGFRRVPVASIELVRQPGRENLERGGRQARRFGRAVVIDVAGELKEELRGHFA